MKTNVHIYILPTNDIDNAAERGGAHRDPDGGSHVMHLLPAHESLRAVHGDGAHCVLSQVLGNLQHQPEQVESY